MWFPVKAAEHYLFNDLLWRKCKGLVLYLRRNKFTSGLIQD